MNEWLIDWLVPWNQRHWWWHTWIANITQSIIPQNQWRTHKITPHNGLDSMPGLLNCFVATNRRNQWKQFSINTITSLLYQPQTILLPSFSLVFILTMTEEHNSSLTWNDRLHERVWISFANSFLDVHGFYWILVMVRFLYSLVKWWTDMPFTRDCAMTPRTWCFVTWNLKGREGKSGDAGCEMRKWKQM